MRCYRTLVILCLVAVLSTGCFRRGKVAAASSAPAPPKPVVRPAPAPPPEPLSIPQTQVQLPPAQPVSDAALATATEVPVVELPEPPSPKPVRRVTSAVPPPGPKPDTPPIAAGPAPPAAPTPVPETERPRIQELVSPAEQKQLTDSLEARRKEIRNSLEQAAARGPSSQEKNVITSIRSFLKLSDEAQARGDLRQADALAERAQILARQLQNGR